MEKFERGIVAGMALAALMLLSPGAAVCQDQSAGGTIAVVGHGSITVPPDLALLTLAVETTSESARAASAANAEKTSAVVGAVKKILKKRDSIRTTNFSLQPRYAPTRRGAEPAPPEITGYVASNQVQVEIRSLDLVGQVLDAAIEAGSNRASGLSFSREDRSPVHEALAKAGAEARAQAESIAAALGVSLGKVVHATTEAPPPVPVFRSLRQEAMAVGDVATPIESGDLTLSATLHVTFAIEAER